MSRNSNRYGGYDGYSGGYGHDSSTTSQSAEELRRQQEAKLEQAQDAMRDALEVKEGKNGKKYILGFIPASDQTAAALKPVINVAMPFINNVGMEAAYKNVSNLAKTNKDLGHKWGMRAAGAVAVVLTTFKPVLEGGRAIKEYWDDESELKQRYALVLEADRRAWKNNEVIKTARNENWNELKNKLWNLGADSFGTAVTGYFAFEKYKNLSNKWQQRHDDERERASLAATASTGKKSPRDLEIEKLKEDTIKELEKAEYPFAKPGADRKR